MNQAAERVGVGRPSKAMAEQRHELLLNHALDCFLEGGFDQTTVEVIAIRVGMSKRTVYARYEDKAALFKAAVERAIERYTVPAEALRAIEADDLEVVLTAVARLRAANLMTPVATKLQRILNVEAIRFPALFDTFFAHAVKPTVDFLSREFTRRHDAGEVNIAEPERAALAFLSLVLGGAARMVAVGAVLDEREVEQRIQFAVRLFLDGVRIRHRASEG